MFKRFRFYYHKVTVIPMAFRTSYVENNTAKNFKVLTESCGFTRTEGLNLLAKHRSLHKIDPQDLKDSFQFCCKLGFSKQDLFTYPSLLVTHPVMKVNHYNSLLDTGCSPIDAALLSNASKYFKSPIKRLKLLGYLSEHDNVADLLLTCVVPPIEKPRSLRVNINILDKKLWTEVHREILVPWLKKRLKATNDQIVRLLRIHQMLKNKSFRTINENINLAKCIGLSNEKIIKCGYLLHNHPEYPKTMLREHPFFAGVEIARAYRVNPKMMMINPRKILEIYEILKEFGVSDEQIQHKPDVFTMSTVTLRERLTLIPTVPEFQPLMRHPKMLMLVVHHKKITNRLDFIKSLKLRCASFKSIGNLCDETFEHFIREGKDVNHPKDVIEFFSRLLNTTYEDIKPKLCSHPYYVFVPFVDIESTYFLLINMGYLVESIAKSPHILLYPRQKVQEQLICLQKKVRIRDAPQHKQLLLAVYNIEKEFHFTGDGIWRTDLLQSSEIKKLE